MSFEPLQKFIPRAAGHYGVSNELKAAKVCHDFRAIVPEIFAGKELPHLHVKPAHYKNGELVINVTSPAWAQEVIMRKTKIIEEMNKKSADEAIKTLKTRICSKEAEF